MIWRLICRIRLLLCGVPWYYSGLLSYRTPTEEEQRQGSKLEGRAREALQKGKRLAALIVISLFVFVSASSAQNPQSQTAPISAINAKYNQGTSFGFLPSKGSGLTLNIGPGTSYCGGVLQTFVGIPLVMVASSTNYVYLDTSANCAPASSVVAFPACTLPVAVVTTGASITSYVDARTAFVSCPGGGGGGGTGISDLNGLTAATQTFVAGTTGTDFAIVSSGGAHNFNLPNAGATARGLVSTGTQSFAGAKTFLSPVTVDDGSSGALTMSGLTSGSVSIGVADISGTPCQINWPTSTGSPGAFLSTNGACPKQQTSWSLVGPGTNVNSASVANPNFNGTNPAAASNNKNVTWQVTGSDVSAEVPAATDTVLGLVKSITCGAGTAITEFATGTGVPTCSASGASGVVNSGTTGQLAYYPGNGATVSGETTWTTAQAPAVHIRRVCPMLVGADNGASVLGNADIGPQIKWCKIPYAATVVEIDVAADAGTPSVIVGRRRCTVFTTGVCTTETVTNLLSGALSAAASGFDACSNTGGTTGLDAGTTCSGTLQNTGVNAGDWLELVSGTAGGTAKRLSVQVVFTVN